MRNVFATCGINFSRCHNIDSICVFALIRKIAMDYENSIIFIFMQCIYFFIWCNLWNIRWNAIDMCSFSINMTTQYHQTLKLGMETGQKASKKHLYIQSYYFWSFWDSIFRNVTLISQTFWDVPKNFLIYDLTHFEMFWCASCEKKGLKKQSPKFGGLGVPWYSSSGWVRNGDAAIKRNKGKKKKKT